MREAMGGTWLFNLVIVFLLLFAGYMCLSINYTKAFNVKDEIINELERYGGFKKTDGTDETLLNIRDYINRVGYFTEGYCNVSEFDTYEYGCSKEGVCESINSNSQKKFSYCLSEVRAKDTYSFAAEGEFVYVSYYKVKVFYELDLPIFGSRFDLNIKGDTKLLYNIDNKK